MRPSGLNTRLKTLRSIPEDIAQCPVMSIPLAMARNQAIDDFERHYLKELLIANHGRINRSAEVAGISARQLHKLMQKHHLHKETFYKDPPLPKS